MIRKATEPVRNAEHLPASVLGGSTRIALTPATRASAPIRVLVTDDSAFMRTAMTRMLESDPSVEVVGTARDGLEALEKVATLDPHVITLDIEMPRLDGLGTLSRIMEENPRPVIMVSSLTQQGAEATLEAFDLGAFECVPKPDSYATLDIITIRNQLIAKVKGAAAATYLRRPKVKKVPTPSRVTQLTSKTVTQLCSVAPEVVALGTSTGGPRALADILPMLPAELPVGIVVVQHMPPGFTGPFAKRLDSISQVTVREAAHEDRIEPGEVLIAPAGWHMTVYRRTHTKYAVRLAKTPVNTLHMPSVDVLMLSVAEVFGARSMGVILTGMGADGAQGMKAIGEKGGLTVGQDEASCVVYGMPRTCAEMGVLKHVIPLGEVPREILLATRHKTTSLSARRS